MTRIQCLECALIDKNTTPALAAQLLCSYPEFGGATGTVSYKQWSSCPRIFTLRSKPPGEILEDMLLTWELAFF